MKNHLALVGLLLVAFLLPSCNKKNEVLKLIPVKVGDEFQYIDLKGKIIINPQFSEATVFRNGIALVCTTGDKPKWGYIDEKGHYIINAQYKKATTFSEGIAWVVIENAAPTMINEKGELLATLQNADEVRIFKEGLAAFSSVNKDGVTKWGFVDTKGTIVIPAQFDRSGSFSEGRCVVGNDKDKWGYIDKSGKVIINYQFASASDFTNGSAVVSNAEKFGAIDKDGKYIINPQFDRMQSDGDLFVISQGSKYGWCDAAGKILINPQFEDAYFFENNKLAPVKSGDKFGYVDRDGKIIINPQFEGAFIFNGNLAIVESSDNKVGFIDKAGKFVINPQFDGISSDYISYVYGGTAYASVETDLFNVEVITNALNLTSPEGLTLNSTFADVMSKFSLQASSFSEYSYQHSIYYSKKITNDAYCTFSVYGSAFNQVQVTNNNGWYSYQETVNQFAPGNKINGYVFDLSLSNRGEGKAKALVTAFVDKLKDFKKGVYNGGLMYYGKVTKVFFSGSSSSVRIAVMPLDGSETEDTNKKMEWSDSSADSTAVVEEVAAVDSAVVAY